MRKVASAFTLIELLIYGAIVSVIVGGFLFTAHYFITSSDKDNERQALYRNESFLRRKFDVLLLGLNESQIQPAAGTAARLEIQRTCVDFIALELVDGQLVLRKNTNGDCVLDTNDQSFRLSDSHVTVSDVSFTRVTHNSAPGIQFQATLTGRFQNATIDKTVYLK